MLFALILLFQLAHSISVDSFILKNADNMIRDTKNKTVQLSGDVQVIYQQQYLSCDEAVIHLETKTIEALGNVVYTTPNVYAEANKMFFNYENNTGIIYNGYVQSGQVSFEGELIYKVGDNEFEASNSSYTSCTTCPPAWTFSGSEIKATFGGYARIKNSVLRVANIPIFWFPYIIVPIKNERQSGVLTPSHEISKQGGNAFSLPFFWAIDDSRDITLTLKNYELKGLKTLFEYRYVLSPKSRGQLNFAHIKDEVFPEENRLTNTTGSPLKLKDRWYLSYNHKYELPSYFEHRVDINLASDLQYSYDYPDEFDFYREPAIPNRMSLSRYHKDYHISMDMIHYTNQLKNDPLANNEEAVHIMPNINLSQKPKRIKKYNLFYSFDFDYVNFARGGKTFDDNNDNFIYDKGIDNVRTGQRLIFRPELSAPLHLGKYLDILPKLSYQYNGYKFAETDMTNPGQEKIGSPRQDFIESQISFRTLLSKIYQGDEGLYKHKLRPFITYTKLPHIARNEHPFWGNEENQPYSSDQTITDTDNLQFDYEDRVGKRDFIEFGFRNVLTSKYFSNNIPMYNDILIWNISQQFDVDEAKSEDKNSEPWSKIRNDIKYRQGRWAINSTIDYYPYQNVVNSTSKFRYFPSSSNYIEVGYNQSFVIQQGVRAVDADSESQDIFFATAYNFGDFNIAGASEYSAITHDFENYQYGIQIMPPGECWFFSISQEVNTQDIKTKFNFEFLFDGKRRRKFSPSEIF